MGKMSRDKGAAYERRVAAMFKEYGWVNAKRHLEVQADEAKFGRDLDGTQPLAVQCKCWGKTPSIAAISEITLDVQYSIPMAVLKRTQSRGTHGLEVAVLPLGVAMRMLSELQATGFLDELADLYA